MKNRYTYLLAVLFISCSFLLHAQIEYVGGLRTEFNNDGVFRGTGTAFGTGSLKMQIEVYKPNWTGMNQNNSGNMIDCKLILRKNSENYDPDYETTTCRANEWLDIENGFAPQSLGTNQHGGGGNSMAFVGYNGNNDIYELSISNIPNGRYSYECRCDDYVDGLSFKKSWDYDNCGEISSNTGKATGDLHYLTVNNSGIFREIFVIDTHIGGNAYTEYYFIDALQPGNDHVSNWQILGSGTNGSLCQNDPFSIGFELNTYKNISLGANVTAANLTWSVTAIETMGISETTTVIPFRDNCAGIAGQFSGGGSCQGNADGSGIGNGIDLVQDQRWQISPDNPSSGNYIDIKQAIIDANGGDFAAGNYILNIQGSIETTDGTIIGNAISRNFSISNETDCLPLPLPIELLSFDASETTSGILLNWVSAMEYDNDYYELERSLDGINFKTIKRVLSKGNSEIKQYYNHLDKEAPEGYLYYRLKQVDVNGEFTYSSIISIKQARSDFFTAGIFPNPAKDFVEVIFHKEDGEDFIVDYRILNTLGQEIQAGKINSFQAIISTNELPDGNYFLALIKNSTRVNYYKLIISQ